MCWTWHCVLLKRSDIPRGNAAYVEFLQIPTATKTLFKYHLFFILLKKIYSCCFQSPAAFTACVFTPPPTRISPFLLHSLHLSIFLSPSLSPLPLWGASAWYCLSPFFWAAENTSTTSTARNLNDTQEKKQVSQSGPELFPPDSAFMQIFWYTV